MRTDRFADPTGSADGSLSRRAFVVAGGSAAGTVIGGGIASADDGGESVVGAAEPYLPAVREAAAASAVDVVSDRARDLDDPPELLVSGRPESKWEAYAVTDVVVDGRAALSNPDGTWRDALRPTDVEERLAADAPVEVWSEVAGDGRAGVERVERPDATAAATALVRGTRAYQYAEGRGGVGYYDVDGTDIEDTAEVLEGSVDGAGSVPVVRLAYVHAGRGARTDDRLASFLDRYGERTAGAAVAGKTFVHPTVEE